MGLVGLAQAQTTSSEKADHEALLLACQQAVACQSHLDKATELYKQDRYTVAIEEFQAAYTLQPYPLILYNIARLHHRQNHLSEAISYYQRYLDSSHPGQLERARELLAEAELASQKSKGQPALTAAPQAPPLASSAPAVPTPVSTSKTPLAPPERRASLPIYKQWWFWSVIGVTVVGAATAIGIGVYAGGGPDVSGLPAQTAAVRH